MRRRTASPWCPLFVARCILIFVAGLIFVLPMHGAFPDARQSAQSQSRQPQSATAPQGSTDQSAPAAAPPATAPSKPKKVYTDDDLAGRGGGAGKAGSLPPNINSCDPTCENRLRAGIEPEDNAAFENQLSAAVESAKDDSLWQQQLVELAQAKQHNCDVLQKKDATKAQLDQARAENVAALQRAANREMSFPTQVVRFSYMGYQVDRIQNGGCSAQR